MFLHSFKYFIKMAVRDKEKMFWILLFPIVLGTLFKLAFGNFSEGEQFVTIPVAVVSDGSETAEQMITVLDELTKEENDSLLKVLHATEAEAKELLEAKEVDGIFFVTDELALSISAQMKNSKLNQSILQSVAEQINGKFAIINDVLEAHPEKIMDVIDSFDDEMEYITEKAFTSGNMRVETQYFYNLIAMACLYTSMTGMVIAVRSQANLSDIGARKNVSPVHKMVSITAEILANIILQTLCVVVSVLYLVFILKIDFGVSLGLLIFVTFIGCVTGVALGFFVGCLGKAKEETKIGRLMAVSMTCCFLSGLMVGNMRMIVEGFCPFINRINPAALITDSMYALNIYDTYDRFAQNILTLLALAVAFSVGGFFVVRRQKYASL